MPDTTDAGPDSALEVGVRFSSDVNGYITGIRFYKEATNTGTHVGNLWRADGTRLATGTFTNETATGWQQLNFSAPVPITAGAGYVASYHTDNGHYSCDQHYFETEGVDTYPLHAPANQASAPNGVYAYGSSSTFPTTGFNSSNYWVDVVFSTNLWSPTTVPGVIDSGPDDPVELGVRFSSTTGGYVTGVRFYKATANTGTHVGNLWNGSGQLLASATFSNETESGWQEVQFASPVAITADTPYVVSYHTSVGHYSDDQYYFESSGVDAAPLNAPGGGPPNGLFAYGSSSTFPASSWHSSNYWVDVVFSPRSATPSPSISGVSGTVSTGQILTITGSNLVQDNKVDWHSFFHGTAYSFEGSDFFSDRYVSGTGDPGATYDTSVKLLGNQSAKFYIPSATTCVPNVGNGGSAPLIRNTYFMRGYVRYSVPVDGDKKTWPDNHLKLFGAQTNASLAYIQPATDGTVPSYWVATLNGNGTWAANPGGTFQNDRWYLVEVEQSADTYTVWVDNQQILSVPFTQTGSPMYYELGIINACVSNYPVTAWIDGFTLSRFRIHPASTIEISDNPTYGAGTVKYQEPVYLSDGSVQFKADFTGLGSGPYYLFVTNNRLARSSAYNLGP
ncbi:DUF4082 domain-containing protein [Geomesophilobacter sediminis]|uniref:DUF4082 domain-containing protein n=1 Tax=Geomesophilobacter sediminis TaxID=2798584 RepID=A0A8J7SB15_9BACT|nr:DUF4082 domain-containing protein [Geomesophilobacter sediminis]MBJ6727566.1 DUF4082 domain-containing protein [Geomesophilobacter sediminis]